MTPDHRYEIKFVVNDVKLSEFYRWLWTGTSMTSAYPERIVNSLYFDDVHYQSVRDNLAGLPNRQKYRIRWYANEASEAIAELKLEKKVREGRLGYKITQPLDRLQDNFLQMQYRDLKYAALEEFEKIGLYGGGHYPDVIPTLRVLYLRQYFQDLNGVRITIDSDIRFFNVDAGNNLYDSHPVKFSKKIIEIKFPPEQKQVVAKMMRPLHLSPQRCSKYLQGLAMNGIVVYL